MKDKYCFSKTFLVLVVIVLLAAAGIFSINKSVNNKTAYIGVEESEAAVTCRPNEIAIQTRKQCSDDATKRGSFLCCKRTEVINTFTQGNEGQPIGVGNVDNNVTGTLKVLIFNKSGEIDDVMRGGDSPCLQSGLNKNAINTILNAYDENNYVRRAIKEQLRADLNRGFGFVKVDTKNPLTGVISYFDVDIGGGQVKGVSNSNCVMAECGNRGGIVAGDSTSGQYYIKCN